MKTIFNHGFTRIHTDEGRNTLSEFRELPRMGTADFEFASIRVIRVTSSFPVSVFICVHPWLNFQASL
jgi:hypothetical protein